MSVISEFQYNEMLARLERNSARDSGAAEAAQCNSRAVERERILHNQILAECRRRGWLVLHSRTDVAATVQIGSPDFIILAGSARTFAVECKRRDGKLRPEQRAWLHWAARLGHHATVCRSFEQFLKFVEG